MGKIVLSTSPYGKRSVVEKESHFFKMSSDYIYDIYTPTSHCHTLNTQSKFYKFKN